MATTGLTGLRPTAALEAAPAGRAIGDAREEALARLSRIALGTELRATVAARLDDGSFLVRIADTAARMSLPSGVQPGSTIRLTLVAMQPRPTFLLGQIDTGSGSATASLSSAGRLIDRMLQLAQRQGMPAGVTANTPLLEGPDMAGVAAPLAERIAIALRDTLGASGLFYESHLGEWAGGDRSLAALLREPQARFARLIGDGPAGEAIPASDQAATVSPYASASSAASSAVSSAASSDIAGGPAFIIDILPLPDEMTHEYSATGQALMANASQAPSADALAASAADDPRAAAMVSMQLEVLEHRRAEWQGHLWPGQPLYWEIGKDAPEHAGSQRESAEPCWHSRVRFQLPALGMVDATLVLQGERLRIQVRAADDDTATLLRLESAGLSSSLDAAGTRLDQLTVSHDASV